MGNEIVILKINTVMDINRLLKEEYGLTNIQLSRITYGLIDQNYMVTSSEGTFFFKDYRAISAENLEKLHGDLLKLKLTGLPVPVVVPGMKELASTDRRYALYEFVEGDEYSSSMDYLEWLKTVNC